VQAIPHAFEVHSVVDCHGGEHLNGDELDRRVSLNEATNFPEPAPFAN
jgi:hypothetical protein